MSADFNDDSPGKPEPEYRRSADGLRVAGIGDLIFAMVPGRDGQHFLASAWRVQRPLDQLKRDDFYSHYGLIENEPAFRIRTVEQAEHSRELKTLSRRVTRIPRYTPWGPSQGATVYAEGVVCHSTASHGGFHLAPDRCAFAKARPAGYSHRGVLPSP